MGTDFVDLYHGIRRWAQERSVHVEDSILPAGQAGEFNGVSVLMNRDYGIEERTYYLLHALGSIVGWSLDKAATEHLFTELEDSEHHRTSAPHRLEAALNRYRAFEEEASQYGVGILEELSAPEFIAAYSNFMRADLEALTEFHRHGRAPVWRQFFSRWNAERAEGRRESTPYAGKRIPEFCRTEIEKKKILQQQ